MKKKYLILIGLSLLTTPSLPATPAGERPAMLAKKLICRYDKEPNRGPDVLYTRLDALKGEITKEGVSLFELNAENQKEVRKDEVAFDWLGSYFRVTIGEETFNYDVWTCDSEDRFYSFPTQQLLDGQKTIQGSVEISIRSDSETHSLTCTAQ
ncbi:MAG: hypothetical protein HYZ71_14470 [Deltaproteobacteria bacterium]|nr:hypothetical protein [Deltaproteobacteria bacterium]